MEEERKTVGRKPTKATRIKNLEKDILQQTLLIKREKLKYQAMVDEYNHLYQNPQVEQV
jgi:hypothetical protein